MDHASKYLVVETLKKESATLIRVGESMYHDKDARFNCKELSERIMAALAEYEKEQAKIVHLKTLSQGVHLLMLEANKMADTIKRETDKF